jgi:DNA-binding HxlR family transcriptional regulator
MVNVTALTQEDVDACPVRSVLVRVTGKWQILILMTLTEGPHRFGALRLRIGDVTQRVLTENLRKLERDGHVIRTVFTGPPIAVSYHLAPSGQELAELLGPLVDWASENFDAITKRRLDFDARNDDNVPL